jgi:hypothetical protein
LIISSFLRLASLCANCSAVNLGASSSSSSFFLPTLLSSSSYSAFLGASLAAAFWGGFLATSDFSSSSDSELSFFFG